MAGTLFVLPSLLILIGLSWLYVGYGQVPLVAGLLYGIKPAVVAIVLQAAHRMGGRTLKSPLLWGVAVASFVAIFAFKFPFPVIVAAAAVLGWLGGRTMPEQFRSGGGHGKAVQGYGPALLDDNTPPPVHARYTWGGLGKVLVAGLLLWAASLGLLTWTGGWQHTLTQMGWFFTKAALLTFGGAYAVLPYVYQGAVVDAGWLSAAQMMDGLALGESTPGPLIMVVAFVGYLGGHARALFGPEALFMAGACAAVVATWFTFLPSFIFIFAGAPLVESTRHHIGLTAPLTAITAAVVGVILNLALFFGHHVFWPAGFEGPVDVAAVLISLGAATALLRFKLGVLPVLAASAVAGCVIKVPLW